MTKAQISEAQTFRQCDNALAVLTTIDEDLGPDAVVELFKAQLAAFLVYVTVQSGSREVARLLLAILADQVGRMAL